MISELKPYPKMKDSGVEWLGEVPEHWEVRRLKDLVENIVDQTSERSNHEIYLALEHVESWTGRIREAGANTSFESQVKRFQAGDVLFGKLRPYLAKVARPNRNGVCVGEFLVLRLRDDNLLPGYLENLLRSKPIINAINATTFGAKMPRADWQFVGSMEKLAPPLPEQTAIVCFLEYADRRIRRYIRAKQKLIALLEEQKRAIIHQAVTGQIDIRTSQPYPAYKPSGVDWLGDVPAHWEVRRVKQATQVLRGKFTHRPRNDPSLYDGPYPFIQTGEVARAEKAITSYRQTLNERGLAVSRMFPAGTLLMTIAANIGDVAVLDFEACFPDSVVGFVPRNNIERDFLYYVFRAMRPELLREAPVNTQGNLNVDRIGSRGIAVAPALEQRLVVRQIEASTAGLNAATNRANRQIDLLREYRTRLIADVVTGKLDVREAAAALPEVDPRAADDELDEPLDAEAESALDELDAAAEEVEA